MERDLVKRMVKKDGSQRISFYRDEYADNPRFNTDEPMHCEDWSREYSIMHKKESAYASSNARDLIEHLLKNFGDYKKIIGLLVENGKHMTDGKSICNNALVYERPMRRWVLKEFTKWYGEKDYEWKDAEYFDCCKEDIDLFELLESVLDSTIDTLVENGCLTDKVKAMSYGFGYHGNMSFYREFSTDSEGIAWLEKDEFLKYSGNGENYWKNNDCYDICKGMVDELEAWSESEVYGFIAENAIKSKIRKEYINVEREDEEYEKTEWEEFDSCWGFYGKFDKVVDDMFDQAGLTKEEFEEEQL